MISTIITIFLSMLQAFLKEEGLTNLESSYI